MTREKSGRVWAVAEHMQGNVRPVTYEVIAFAGEVAKKTGGALTVVVIGHPVTPVAEEIARVSGCDVIGIDCEAAVTGSSNAYRFVLKKLFETEKPDFIFIPHTPTGWDFAPSLAVDIEASCITAVGAMKDEAGLLFSREICNGKLIEDLRPLPGRAAIVTIMPGASRPEAAAGNSGKITIMEMTTPEGRAKTLKILDAPAYSPKLKEAEVVVSAGRGIRKEQHLDIIRELASEFERGVVAASRPVIDAGWLPMDSQVGMTGQTVSPKAYIACGISGAVQHTMGMKGANLIVAINTDKNALICKIANYCVIEDLHKFIPVLIEKIRNYKNKKP